MDRGVARTIARRLRSMAADAEQVGLAELARLLDLSRIEAERCGRGPTESDPAL
jgi:hypothetical protein